MLDGYFYKLVATSTWEDFRVARRSFVVMCIYLYTGHGGTPISTLNCFGIATSEPNPSTLSGIEMQGFGFQGGSESEIDSKQGFGVTNGVHLYDFPSLSTSKRGPAAYRNTREANKGLAGHSYEFPDHYHLATQYEVPVASYEKPRPQARLHIYKNTLPADVYVPTLVGHII